MVMMWIRAELDCVVDDAVNTLRFLENDVDRIFRNSGKAQRRLFRFEKLR